MNQEESKITDTTDQKLLDLSDFEMANDAIKLDQIPIWHDQKDKYKELENFICVLEEGCSFGELAMAP